VSALEVVLLGTGSPLPDPLRAGPSTLVEAGTLRFLFDCGRGVLMRAAAAGTGANQLTAALLTHLHSDHLTDLNDVITTRWITTFTPTPLTVIGPAGTAEVVDGIRASLRPDVAYRLEHHDDLTWEPPVAVTEVSDGVVFEADGTRIVAAPTDHRPVRPTVGYRVERGGHAVVLAGDTVPCAGLDRLCEGADALVCTVIRDDLLRAIGLPRLLDVCDYHSTVQQAAETAKRGGVETLVLTHCVPAVAPGAEEEWRALAAAHFDGTVIVAADLTRVAVG
jgi:ribonuclease Z